MLTLWHLTEYKNDHKIRGTWVDISLARQCQACARMLLECQRCPLSIVSIAAFRKELSDMEREKAKRPRKQSRYCRGVVCTCC